MLQHSWRSNLVKAGLTPPTVSKRYALVRDPSEYGKIADDSRYIDNRSVFSLNQAHSRVRYDSSPYLYSVSTTFRSLQVYND